MKSLLSILQALVLASLIVLAWAVILTIHVFQPKAEAFVRDAHVTVLEIGLTAKNLREASVDWKAASKAQVAYVTKTERAASKSFADLDATIKRADESLNGEVLPTLAQSIFDADVSVQRVSHSAESTLSGVDDVTRELAADLGDPAVRQSLSHIETASANLADTSKDVQGIAADTHAETSLILGQTRKAFAPEAKWKSIGKMLIEGTLNGAELYFYLTH